MILVIDNYDSFVYNLAQYLGELGQEPHVRRNDRVTIAEIDRLRPSHIVISPGPCTPLESGISNEVIRQFGGKVPILGVCLGHQCIGHVYGARIVRARRPFHGKTYAVEHDGRTVYRDIPNPFQGARYHSLVVSPEEMPGCLQVTALTREGEIMGVRHREYTVEGVQFHPESILTEQGHKLLSNFLTCTKGQWG